jgi:hypothetical protein
VSPQPLLRLSPARHRRSEMLRVFARPTSCQLLRALKRREDPEPKPNLIVRRRKYSCLIR